jgi:hypothetical protein
MTISELLVRERPLVRKGNIMKTMPNDPTMLAEYDFSNSVRGKYADKYADGTNVVVIDKDIIAYFPDHDAVNQALRSIIPIIKKHDLIAD